MAAGGTLPRVREATNAHAGSRPLWLRSVDRASVALFACAWGAVAWRLASSVEPARLALLIVLALPVAIVLADLASGLVHWFADRYLDPETPVLGPMLIEPFREHHRDPQAMTRHDFFEVSGNNGLVTLPLAAIALALEGGAGAPLAPSFAVVTMLVFALAIFATNQLHAWAHAERAPRLVRRLQRAQLILPPEAHAMHHAHGHDRAYCVTTGWLNPALDRLGFFAAIESMLARAGLRVASSAQPEAR